ncbi:MAG: hypothetical protein VR64_15300 [Desulfatitalea sp. BRH_c12]|nr:MAG: hypothetical protein VR64_15300 [Desulfatitalea sp. BRH_c12]
MQTLEVLDKKIRTAQDLLSVVKTMKALAAVNIRQYERAVASLEAYRRVVDHGWQALFRYGGVKPGAVLKKKGVIIVIGTDQGMCGQFNQLIASAAVAEYQILRGTGMDVAFWCVGEKVVDTIAGQGSEAALQYQAPASLNTVHTMVNDMTRKLEAWKTTRGTEFFYLCHNVLSGKAGYEQTCHPFLPLDNSWVAHHKDSPWPSKCLPLLGLPGPEMFGQLFGQYLYICLYRALVQSIAAENAARLVAMQAAEKNITELEEDLRKMHREQRQMSITTELLDIMSGFEALNSSDSF